MPRKQVGVTGRYQARCGGGLCALTGDQATSKLQGSLFAVLDYAIGGGRQDVTISLGTRVARLDMVFNLPGGKLIVEYDGAYWHRGREEQDFLKARRIEDWYGSGCMVVRVREYPLEPTSDGRFTSPDLQVPARVDAATCGQLVLLHLLHVMWRDLMGSKMRDRVLDFLLFASRPLTYSSVLCGPCREAADHFRLPTADSLTGEPL